MTLNAFIQFARMSALALLLAACNLTTTDTITPVPTPDLPTVEILEPTNNRQVINGTEFAIDIVAQDTGSGIARIDLFVGEERINSSEPVEAVSVPVFRTTMNWLAQGEGFHVLEAVAYRLDDTPSDPALVTIEVLPR